MKDVLIKIKGVQTTPGNSEEIELTTLGKMWRRNGGWRLRYPETAATGMEGAETTVSVADTIVEMRRKGPMDTRMTVERDKRHLCLYDTGFGEMTVGVFGQNVESSLGEHGGECFMRYTIDINSGFESVNELHITVKELGVRS